MPTAAKARQRTLAEKVDPRNTALVVVDMQNDFCHADGYFGKRGGDLSAVGPAVAKIEALVAEARRLDMLILWVRAHYDDINTGAAMADAFKRSGGGEERLVAGSWGADWLDGLRPNEAPNEVIVSKHRYSAFHDSPIDLLLRSNAIENIVVTGTSTDVCVESTVRDAFFHDYFVVVPADAACARPDAHGTSIDVMDRVFGTAPSTAEVLALWKTADAKGPRGWKSEAKAAAAFTDLEALVDPAHTALVIVDMQNDFCHPDGVMARAGSDLSSFPAAIATIKELIAAAREAGTLVVHVYAELTDLSGSAHSRGLVSERETVARLCRAGTWGAEIVEELAPRPGEPMVPKQRYSGFVGTRLGTLLRANGIRTVVVTGTAAQTCVDSTVRDAQMNDYRVVVPQEGVCSRGKHQHLRAASLETLGLYFAEVVSAKQILGAWSSLRVESAAD